MDVRASLHRHAAPTPTTVQGGLTDSVGVALVLFLSRPFALGRHRAGPRTCGDTSFMTSLCTWIPVPSETRSCRSPGASASSSNSSAWTSFSAPHSFGIRIPVDGGLQVGPPADQAADRLLLDVWRSYHRCRDLTTGGVVLCGTAYRSGWL